MALESRISGATADAATATAPAAQGLTAAMLADPVLLTRALVDIESVSGNEKEIADVVEVALRGAGHLVVDRVGNVVRARTELGRSARVVLAGHLDTVPVHANLPATVSDDGAVLSGCGTTDMKSGCAIALYLAVQVAAPVVDVTYLFYDCEEVGAERNGLNIISATHPDWLAADFAILLEPTYGRIEAGCQGVLRAIVRVPGRRAHAARSWRGSNAIHHAGEVLRRLAAYRSRRITIDGCEFREGLNAVAIQGGVASNVIPDSCEIEVSFRFAPDRSLEQAAAYLREVFEGFQVDLVDQAPAAPPGLTAPLARDFVEIVGTTPAAKLGWTDVARFATLGVPALNYGPGDSELAHASDERVEVDKIMSCTRTLLAWLTRETG